MHLDAEKVVGGTKLHKVTSTITAGISLHEAEQTEKLPDTKPTVTSEEMTGTKPKHPASLDEGIDKGLMSMGIS
mgnify:FL=1